MSISRRCQSCRTWNADEPYCTNCGATLDPELLRAEHDREREALRPARGSSRLDRFFDRLKNSPWMLVRGIYWVVYSVWFAVFSILTFFIALIAGTPG